MPELPEVETIVRDLLPRITGLRINAVEVRYPSVLRSTDAAELDRIRNKRVRGLRRRGKMILVDLTENISLIFHLKMTGQMLLSSNSGPVDKHTHLIISFNSGRLHLRFRDVRKFGFVACMPTTEVFKREPLKSLGPEPLGMDFSGFAQLFKGRKGRLKGLLMRQDFLAGIGNMYADEILFHAKLHPTSLASRLRNPELFRLWKAMGFVLREAIEQKGSSLRDFTDAWGRQGNFQNLLRIYGREGLPCEDCGCSISRIRLGGRSSYFCPQCQPVM